MKLPSALSAATLLAISSGCFGGGDVGDTGGGIEPPPPPPPPDFEGGDPLPQPMLGAACEPGAGRGGARGGIWVGGSQTSEPGEMRLLVAETGEFRWISPTGWDQQIFGTFLTPGGSLTSDDAVWVWVDGLTWLETEFAGVNMQGELDEESNLSLGYEFESNPDSGGTLSFSACNSVYTRGSSLAFLAGTYVNGNRMLAIDGQGEIFFQDRSCVGDGSVELIDPDFNLYRMELTVSHCAGNEVHSGGTFSGLAYLGDSGAGFTGDLLEYSLSFADEHSILFWTDSARK